MDVHQVKQEDILFRPATAEDVPGLVWLTQLLAEDEFEPHGMKIGEKEFLRDGFGDEKYFHVILAELKPTAPLPPQQDNPIGGNGEVERPSLSMPRHDRLVGYSLYFFNYSTWEGRVLYMEDLYIRKEFRSVGIGTRLMKEVAKIGVAKDCKRMVWQVLDWNTRATELYERLGGSVVKEWLTVRMYADSLRIFAAGDQSAALSQPN